MATGQVGPQGASTVTVLSQTVVFDNTQILSLPTAVLVIVPAQTGAVLCFHSATLITNVAAAPYTNTAGRQLFIGYGTNPLASFPASGNIDADASLGGVTATVTFDTMSPLANVDQDISDVLDKPLSLFVFGGSGNFVGGDTANTLKVAVFYTMLEEQ